MPHYYQPSSVSLDFDRSTFIKPFATASSSRSLQSKKSVSDIVSLFTKSFTTRKLHTESKLKASDEINHNAAEVLQESTHPSTTAHQQDSIPLPSPTRMNLPKSQSFMSRFASKFQRSQRTPQKNTPSSQMNDRVSQERREAALRARGLLPQKDLSQLEKERDLFIDSVDRQPADFSEPTSQSAADEIKRAWERKNAASLALTPPSPSQPASLVDPRQIPLPPSPTPSISELPDIRVMADPCSIPLPPSPHIEPVRSKNLQNNFRQWKFPKDAAPIADSLAVAPVQSPLFMPQKEESLLVPPSPTVETESVMDASIMTPSLTADSIARTVSTASAAETTDSISTSASAKELRIQTAIAPGVSVIVESPIEETILDVIPEVEAISSDKDHSAGLPIPTRRTTDPEQIRPQKKPHKLSIRNIHRSVVGTLSSKPKSPRFDGMPPSPQLPTSPVTRLSPPSRSTTTGPGLMRAPSTRTPCSPTMYNCSAIVLEANNIEDEESRRLSEMAFLT